MERVNSKCPFQRQIQASMTKQCPTAGHPWRWSRYPSGLERVWNQHLKIASHCSHRHQHGHVLRIGILESVLHRSTDALEVHSLEMQDQRHIRVVPFDPLSIESLRLILRVVEDKSCKSLQNCTHMCQELFRIFHGIVNVK